MDKLALITFQEGYLGIATSDAQEGDCLCVLLGLDAPILLRPVASGNYAVVGICFVHGLMDGEGLLGSIPSPWKVLYKNTLNTSESSIPYFVNSITGERLDLDPRLPPLPEGWESVDRKSSRKSSTSFRGFKNTKTGETFLGDPRMSKESLQERGILLETFRLT